MVGGGGVRRSLKNISHLCLSILCLSHSLPPCLPPSLSSLDQSICLSFHSYAQSEISVVYTVHECVQFADLFLIRLFVFAHFSFVTIRMEKKLHEINLNRTKNKNNCNSMLLSVAIDIVFYLGQQKNQIE